MRNIFVRNLLIVSLVISVLGAVLIFFAGPAIALAQTSVSPQPNFIINGEIGGGPIYSGSSGLRSGWTNSLPANAVVVEIGYGSDDHDYHMEIQQGSFEQNPDLTWHVKNGGTKAVSWGSERRGALVTLIPPTDSFMTEWGWDSSHTSGGIPGNDGWPSQVCVHAKYQLYNPATFQLIPGEYQSGNCSSRGYPVPSGIRGLIRADQGKFIVGIQRFQFGNDAKLFGGSMRYRTITNAIVQSSFVSDTIPTNLMTGNVYSGTIMLRNSGGMDWFSDSLISKTGDCSGYVPGPAAGECHETHVLGSSVYKLMRLDTSSVILTSPIQYERAVDVAYSSYESQIACDERTDESFGGQYFLSTGGKVPIQILQRIHKIFAGIGMPFLAEAQVGCVPVSEWITVVTRTPSPTISNGATATFPISFTTTNTSGPMNLRFQMAKSDIGRQFGDIITIPLTVNAPAPTDFSLSVIPTSRTAAQGTAAIYTVSAAAVGVFSDPINLSVQNSPAGITATFVPASITPGQSATLTLDVGANIPPSTYTFDVVGTSGGLAHGAATDIVVTQRPYAALLDISKQQFVLSSDGPVGDTALIMNSGETMSSFIVSCSSDQPWIVVESCPSGPYVAGQPSASQLLVASVATSSSQVGAPGIYNGLITVSATPQSPTMSVTPSFRVVGIEYTANLNDFTVTVTPDSQGAPPGSSLTYMIDTTAIGNFSSPVIFSTQGLPQGVSPSFAPGSVTPGQTATLTLAIGSTVAPGSYAFNVIGTSGLLSRSYTVVLDVLQAGDFQISIAPQLQSAAQNTSTTYTVMVDSGGSFNAPVTLNVSGTPSGVAESLSRGAINPGESAVLTMDVGNGVLPGTYPIEVVGTSGALTHAASADLEVVARPYDAELDVSKQQFALDKYGQRGDVALIMNTGEVGTSFTATCQSNQSWLLVDNCPTQPYVAGSETENQLFVAHVDASSGAVVPEGTYFAQVTISATAQGQTRSVNSTPRVIDVSYTVPSAPPTGGSPPYGFGLVVFPQSRTVDQGNSVTYTVTSIATGDFASPIVLTASGLPQGVTASFSKPTIGLGEASTLTVDVSGTTTPAIYRFNVNGTSETLSDTKLTGLTVNGPGGPINPNDPNRVTCGFSADPSVVVLPNNTSVLSWLCQNAQSCNISQGIGDVNPASGTIAVAPTSTTAYLLFCSNTVGGFGIPAEVQVFSSGRVEIIPR